MISIILNNVKLILAGLFVGALAFGVVQCDRKQYYKEQEQKQINNIKALADSVEYYENRAGELTAEKLALQSDKKQLKSLNNDLYNELEKERDRVEYLAKINTEIRGDTLESDSSRRSNIGFKNWRFDWTASHGGDGWSREIEGVTFISVDSLGLPYNHKLLITKDYLNTQIVTGITERGGQKRIFVRSSYPRITFTDIQGAIIEEREDFEAPSRFGVGPQIGGGLSPNGFTSYIGFGINFNLITF